MEEVFGHATGPQEEDGTCRGASWWFILVQVGLVRIGLSSWLFEIVLIDISVDLYIVYCVCSAMGQDTVVSTWWQQFRTNNWVSIVQKGMYVICAWLPWLTLAFLLLPCLSLCLFVIPGAFLDLCCIKLLICGALSATVQYTKTANDAFATVQCYRHWLCRSLLCATRLKLCTTTVQLQLYTT